MTDTSDLATHTAPPDPTDVTTRDAGNAGTPETPGRAQPTTSSWHWVCRLVGDVDAHATRLARVEEQTDSLAGFVDRFEETFTGIGTDTSIGDYGAGLSPTPTGDANTTGPAVADGGKPAGLNMRELVAWVGDNVAALLERKIPQTGGAPYWCRRWWLHPEAIARFEAARRCWVDAVASEGAAMVVYFEHLDAMLAALCGENGPFCGCVGGQHNGTGISTALGQDDPGEDYYRSFEHPDAPRDY